MSVKKIRYYRVKGINKGRGTKGEQRHSLRLVINVTSVACVKEAEKRAIVPGPEDLEGQAS